MPKIYHPCCSNIKSLDLTTLDIEKVTDMSGSLII